MTRQFQLLRRHPMTDLRPTFGDPDQTTEGWDEEYDRAINDSARWDLSWGCAVTISHQHAYGGHPECWSATVALSDSDARRGIVTRVVTQEQIRSYARHLLALADRFDLAPVARAAAEETP
jgi:hypothetical protein